MTKKCLERLKYLREYLWKKDFERSAEVELAFEQILDALIEDGEKE